MNIRHYTEAFFIKGLYYLFSILPMPVASSIGGFIGRNFGRWLGVNSRARKNLAKAFPEKNEQETERIIKGMWEHLGRVVAEFPHIAKMGAEEFARNVEVEGEENLDAGDERETGAIFFSGHLGNWELLPKVLHEKGQKDAHVIYRKANNPYVDELINGNRSKYPAVSIPKGSVGARRLIRALQNNKSVVMLVDQKQNDGIAVPFFGRPAMTAPAIANLALKYGCALVPVQVIRKKGIKFKIKIYPPLNIDKTSGDLNGEHEIMFRINMILESWIREHPEQWFWVHNRWPRSH